MTSVFIDGDTIAFASAVSAEKSVDEDKVQVVLGRVKQSLQNILDKTQATEYKLYLSDDTSNTFRKAMYPAYKSNRPLDKPLLLLTARDYMINVWGAGLWPGLEADDAVAIEQTRVQHTGIIAAIDKDLLQVPGRVFNWRTNSIVSVSPLEGAQQLYKQCLMGDTTDNIKGLAYCGDSTITRWSLTAHARRGCGEKSALGILAGGSSEREFYERTLDAYKDTYGESEGYVRLQEQMNLVYLIREYHDSPVLWTPPA